MLMNVHPADELRGLAILKARPYDAKSIHPLLADEATSQGWSIVKRTKRNVRLQRPKAHNDWLEDRVWTLLYRMGFTQLSGEHGAQIQLDPKDPKSPLTQLDAVAIDDETAVAIECKSAEKPGKRPQFQDELGKFSLVRPPFASCINQQRKGQSKKQVGLAMFTSHITLSENDRKRAQEANIVLFDEQDLEYYEGLVSHLGIAARYQFLADLLSGKTIPGLEMKVPAIRAKMGAYVCYTFAIPPDYLLKIAYVSHRAKGKASDVNTYQRMIKRSRLRVIRRYILENGIFPTNIVISFDRPPRFERTEQATEQPSGVMGWLNIRATYKSAWIIDGQHRLFAYSGLDVAAKARLSVLAFENLPASNQAKLFIDINAEQKSVKQSLLQELYAELHWNATEPAIRVRAIVSKAIQSLNADPECAFYQRILSADETKDATRCISLTSLFRALEDSDLYLAPARKAGIVEYGPMWAGDDNEATRKRTVNTLMGWFEVIKDHAHDWWQIGSGEGGGLAMNDGITACVLVLRSVFHHLTANGERLLTLTDEELSDRIQPYAQALGDYLGSLSLDERKRFRDLRGVQGQTTRMRRCQQALHDRIPSFSPPGLQEFIETEEAQTNARAKTITDRIEKTIKKIVLRELKREFGLDESQWWIMGIPQAIRVKVTERFEKDDARRGGKEHYFDLIDYRHIVSQHWAIFANLLGYGKANTSKEKRTAWMSEVNDIRRVWAHASSGQSVTLEQLARLEHYDQWLSGEIHQTGRAPVVEEDAVGETIE